MQQWWHEFRHKGRSSHRHPPFCRPFCSTQVCRARPWPGAELELEQNQPWAHLLTQASVREEGPLRQEHHTPGAKAGQHFDAPCTETQSHQAGTDSQELLTTPCAVLPHGVANKSQNIYICTTGQSNERQSRICNTETHSATHSSSQGGTGLTTPHC